MRGISVKCVEQWFTFLRLGHMIARTRKWSVDIRPPSLHISTRSMHCPRLLHSLLLLPFKIFSHFFLFVLIPYFPRTTPQLSHRPIHNYFTSNTIHKPLNEQVTCPYSLCSQCLIIVKCCYVNQASYNDKKKNIYIYIYI